MDKGFGDKGFGQFCPVALASEVLAQKWMLLIVRELAAGSTRFNDIHRGVPRISATLLKQRLETLEHHGIVERRSRADAAQTQAYRLTEAGEELKPVLASIGTWGQRWAREIDDDDLDPGWLVWNIHRRLDTGAMPPGRTIIEIRFSDAPANARSFWLVHEQGDVDVCLKPPGHDPDVVVTTTVRILAEVWRGLRALKDEIADGRVVLEGKDAIRRRFPNWLMLSVYAGIERRRP